MFSKMYAKAQAVEKGACAEHAVVTAGHTRNIGKRIRWVRDCDQHCVWRDTHNLWDNVSIDFSVLFKESKPTSRIIAICCTARLFVDARRNKHNARSG